MAKAKSTAPVLLPGEQGRYAFLEHIASGGMGDVFLARDTVLDRKVVIKCMSGSLSADPEFVKMFRDEARTVAKLNHVNIVSVFDFGVMREGHPFMVMEWLEGWDLSAILAAHRRRGDVVPLGIGLRLVADACRGLHAAHTAKNEDGSHLGLIHRDVSPQNLFVTQDGVLKILDFGVAKHAARETKTSAGQVKGKFAYMAPEQFIGKQVDRRADLFALGVVLHEILSGRTLFGALTPQDARSAIASQPIAPPFRVGEALAPEVVRLTMRALERKPEARFDSAEAMGDALEATLRSANLAVGQSQLAAYVDGLLGAGRFPPAGQGEPGQTSLTVPIGRLEVSDQTPVSQQITRPFAAVAATVREVLTLVKNLGAGATRIDRGPFASTPPRSDADGRGELGTLGVPAPGKKGGTAVDSGGAVRTPDLRRRSTSGAHALLSRSFQAIDKRMLVAAFVLGLLLLGLLLGPVRARRDRSAPQPETTVKPERANPPAVSGTPPATVQGPPIVIGPTPKRANLGDKTPARGSRPTKAPSRTEPSANEERPRAMLGTSRLSLETVPLTTVFVDGRRMGETPLLDKVVPAGSINIRMVNADLGIDATRTMVLPVGGNAKFRIVLDEK